MAGNLQGLRNSHLILELISKEPEAPVSLIACRSSGYCAALDPACCSAAAVLCPRRPLCTALSLRPGWGPGALPPNCPQTHRLVLTTQEMLQERVKAHPENYGFLGSILRFCKRNVMHTQLPHPSHGSAAIISSLKQVNYN